MIKQRVASNADQQRVCKGCCVWITGTGHYRREEKLGGVRGYCICAAFLKDSACVQDSSD